MMKFKCFHHLFIAFFSHLYILTIFFTLVSCRCPHHQKSALLDLFSNRSSLSSWTDDGYTSHDCCQWEGITCDPASGHVIGLDLTNHSISVSINHSVFTSLGSLRFLNLSYNDFGNSIIPSNFDCLSNLTHLNLSHSGFAGQIPATIGRMTNLVVLDFSSTHLELFDLSFYDYGNNLKLEEPSAAVLLRNLSRLTKLHLDGVNISSAVPPFLSNFTRLTSLSLSHCNLVGEFPATIFQMPRLETLDVSGNSYLNGSFPDFPRESALRTLKLSSTSFSGQIPPSLLNITKLAVLILYNNNFSTQLDSWKSSVGDHGGLRLLEILDLGSKSLHGTIPLYLFTLPSLRELYLDSNQLEGELHEFGNASSTLELIYLNYNKLQGQIPISIFSLPFLRELYLAGNQLEGVPHEFGNASSTLKLIHLRSNKLQGQIPISIFSLPSLRELYLDGNQLEGVPHEFGNASSTLETISLRYNKLQGKIPLSIFSLPSLRELYLDGNQLEGVPHEFRNASSTLEVINLSSNKLQGQIPISIFRFRRLQTLDLSSNMFNGSVDFAMLPRTDSLVSLDLSRNSLVVNVNYVDTFHSPQFEYLGLSSCSLKQFPHFLRRQVNMWELDLSNNKIAGEIPSWIWTVGSGNLNRLNLSGNSLTSLQRPYNLSSSSLEVLDLRSNQLQGEIPLPPNSIQVLDYSKNNFTSTISTEFASVLGNVSFFSISSNNVGGDIPPSICNAKRLVVLDLSNNSLTGPIPNCVNNLKILVVLNVKNNQLTGMIPDISSRGDHCTLRTLNLNGNQLEGKLPESLSSCGELELLDVGNNRLSGHFPYYHNILSTLRVLVLRSNQFSGSLSQLCNLHAPLLQIMDASSNSFSGTLPAHCFGGLNALMSGEGDKDAVPQKYIIGGFYDGLGYYQDTVMVTTKGLDLELVKITTIFKSLDLSNNKLEGELPKEIGALKWLRVLNMSHNFLMGQIPASIGNARQLESLDLSRNQFSGRIPLEMNSLTFLEVLNLSYNGLVGSIPTGPQFLTFNNDSFIGNPELCGQPLSRKCENSSSNSAPEEQGSGSSHVNWLVISVEVGFTVGLGIVFGPLLLCRKWRLWYFKRVDMMLAYLQELWYYYSRSL